MLLPSFLPCFLLLLGPLYQFLLYHPPFLSLNQVDLASTFCLVLIPEMSLAVLLVLFSQLYTLTPSHPANVCQPPGLFSLNGFCSIVFDCTCPVFLGRISPQCVFWYSPTSLLLFESGFEFWDFPSLSSCPWSCWSWWVLLELEHCCIWRRQSIFTKVLFCLCFVVFYCQAQCQLASSVSVKLK